jgi:hypothetical protein
MRVLRIAACLALTALFAGTGTVSARSNELAAPKGLHAFLLRADEPRETEFNRTPAFAWNPVPGATSYEFQLSTSGAFRDNGVIYADRKLSGPVSAPSITLPWITGSPHSLYARVRAVTQSTTSPWSDAFGFDLVPSDVPKPLPSYPGLLRWTPVDGASAYEVWLIDVGKKEVVTSNVLDEREFYTLHQASLWTSTVRWRIRAIRWDVYNQRINGIPVSSYGAWSPVYSSTNPSPQGGPIKLLGTVSDVFSNGSDKAPAHRLMPAFLFTGNESLDGEAAELYRIDVFTDKQCLNPVLIGSPTGAPAFAARPYGPLSMPSFPAALQASRSNYLPDAPAHTQSKMDFGFDGSALTLSEQAQAAKPTTDIPNDPGDDVTTAGTTTTSGGTGGGGLTVSGDMGAPVNLWDNDWPSAGYYWTVIPVTTFIPGQLDTFVRAPGAKSGATILPVASITGFNVGDTITIGSETTVVTGIGDGQLAVGALTTSHSAGELVERTGGNVQYVDMEMPQDACAAGRVARFGKSSEPALTSSGDLFATGLSPSGRLTSALHTPAFYGSPLVSWTPALGADAYQVQWSKTKYPFVPEKAPTGAKGFVTTGTSSVLPLTGRPGTYYYRIRGFDYSLPSGAQQMSWSDPAKVVVTTPKFRVAPAAGKKFKVLP